MTTPIDGNRIFRSTVLPELQKPKAPPPAQPSVALRRDVDSFDVARRGPVVLAAVTPLAASGGGPVALTNEQRDAAQDALGNVPPNPSALANALRDAGDDRELRRALIAEAFESGQAAGWLDGEVFSSSRKGHINEGYDDLTEIADAVGEAYRAGDVTPDPLRQLAEDLGPDAAAELVQTLALGTNNGGNGGVVEALGEAAQSLGFDEAAALAFTSTDGLIEEHYPTPEAQREAFGHLNDFIERWDQEDDALDGNVALRNAVGSAVVNAARLSANGNGWSPEQLDDELKELGPTLSGEIIAQAGERLFNGEADGPLDLLGDSAARLAGSEDGDDQELWRVNSAIAYTQSPELIEANLGSADARHEAFDTLNAYLAESRGEWSLASRDGYSLVRAPQAVEGLNRLLTTHPETLSELLDEGAQGEADLVQLFESVSLVPEVPQAERDALQHTLERYVQDQLDHVEPGNANAAGERIGKLLGAVQVAANRAVDGAEAGDSQVKELALNLASSIAGAGAQVALTSVTGPLGSLIGGKVVTDVLRSLFKEDPPSESELQDAFVDRLKEAGIDVSAGERSHDALGDLYRALHDELTAQLTDPSLTPAQRDALRTQLDVTQGVLNGLETFGDTLDSGEDAGELNVILNDRHDDP